MIPKTIHLCWFSTDPYPVEIKVCLNSWKQILPDYTIKLWTYKDAQAIGIPYVNEALSARKWAFAADVVRFYAVYTEGGVYMIVIFYSKNDLMNSSRHKVLQHSLKLRILLFQNSDYKLHSLLAKKEIHFVKRC